MGVLTMGRIQTGVDKLIALVHEKQKIPLDEAAKALGVSKAILQEWSDFLEEEGLLEVKYSLSKTYLIEKKLSKNEVTLKEKQFENQRETFIRKTDTAVTQLESETTGFENFKKEFQVMKGELGGDLEHIQKELEQLQEYQKLKQEVSSDLNKQHAQFQKKQQETDQILQREYRRYQEVITAVSEQEKRLAAQHTKVKTLLASEENVQHKVQEFVKLLQTLQSKADEETKQLGMDESALEKLRSQAMSLHKELDNLVSSGIKPLQALKEQNEMKLKNLEQKILTKAITVGKDLKNPASAKQAVKKKLEEFFKRKKVIETMLDQIDRDKSSLRAELVELQKRAQAYQLGKTAVRLEELESKLSTLEERKKALHGHISKFLKILK